MATCVSTLWLKTVRDAAHVPRHLYQGVKTYGWSIFLHTVTVSFTCICCICSGVSPPEAITSGERISTILPKVYRDAWLGIWPDCITSSWSCVSWTWTAVETLLTFVLYCHKDLIIHQKYIFYQFIIVLNKFFI